MNPISTSFNRFVDDLAHLLEPFESKRRARRALILVERGDGYDCYRLGDQTPERIAAADLAKRNGGDIGRKLRTLPVELRLDADRVVSRDLNLPAASREYLDAIIRHQLERLTPWAADRVVFDYALLDQAEASEGQIALRVVATSRDTVDNAVKRLAAAGIRPVAVGTAEDPVDQPSEIDLLDNSKTDRLKVLARRVKIGLLAMVAVFVVAGSYATWRLLDAESAAQTLDGEIAQNRRVIDAAIARTGASDEYRKLAGNKQATTPVIVLLNDLTKLIPDSTYLTELSIDGPEVHISGFSTEVPKLIALLQDSPSLTEARFAAPTMRAPDGVEDSFQIVAKLRQPGSPKS